MDQYPKWAEQFTASDYIEAGPRIPSKILLGKTLRGQPICHCPRCGFKFKTAWDHGVGDQCDTCDLNVLIFGNSIFVWNTEPPTELIEGEIVDEV